MAENVEAESAQEPIDAGLRCLHCGYNLTGTVESRCPECGEGFDLADLERFARGEPVPATPFDLEQSWVAFWRTWRRVVFSPGRFVDELPPAFDGMRAAQFAANCYLMAGVFLAPLVAGVALVFGPGLTCLLEAYFVAAALFSFWLVGTVTARLLSWICPPARTHHSWPFWRGVGDYSSSFVVLFCGWCSAASLTIAAAFLTGVDLFISLAVAAGLGGALAIVAWSMIALFAMIWRRSRSIAGALAGSVGASFMACVLLAASLLIIDLVMFLL